jgi:DNA-binding NarL/FixJ family response regulator
MRVIIASGRASLRSALRTLIQTRRGVEIVAIAKNKQELLHLFEATRPDLLLLDEDLHEAVLDTIVAPMQELDPDLSIVILGQRSESKEAYLKAGVLAFLTKYDAPKCLLTAIEEARLQRKHV